MQKTNNQTRHYMNLNLNHKKQVMTASVTNASSAIYWQDSQTHKNPNETTHNEQGTHTENKLTTR